MRSKVNDHANSFIIQISKGEQGKAVDAANVRREAFANGASIDWRFILHGTTAGWHNGKANENAN